MSSPVSRETSPIDLWHGLDFTGVNSMPISNSPGLFYVSATLVNDSGRFVGGGIVACASSFHAARIMRTTLVINNPNRLIEVDIGQFDRFGDPITIRRGSRA